MKILFTTGRSDLLGGKEAYTRDVALGLMRRGHDVAVTSHPAPDAVRSMATEGIAVYDRWHDLPFVPDVIHGQNLFEMAIALSAFPHAPAFYQTHSGGPVGNPAKHPRIYRYGGMSEWITMRLATELGIPLSSTVVIPNSVDLAKFASVRRLPPRPRRALFYNSYHRPGSQTFEAVRAAALESGLELDCVGRPFGNRIERPQDVLHEYDLVFACGISAIEALCSGCAVIVLSMTSCGDLIDASNFERHRAANFAIPFNARPTSQAAVTAEIARYDADACGEVARRARSACDGERMLDLLLEVYAGVLADHRAAGSKSQDERVATVRFLRRVTSLVGAVDAALTDRAMPLTRAAAIALCEAPVRQLVDRVGSATLNQRSRTRQGHGDASD